MNKIRVLIIDDSALVRCLLKEILAEAPSIEVIGTAADPYDARAKIKKLNPDVLTLDIEMPRMDGITFLGNLMRLRPMPVVMVSSLTEQGADVTLRALELGAVDFVAKPGVDLAHKLHEYASEIIAKVQAAARANVHPICEKLIKETRDSLHKQRLQLNTRLKTTNKVLAIGASTGGTEAIREILEVLPPDAPGTVITQHIAPPFSRSFAARMDGVSALKVCEAAQGQRIMPGHAYIAPGDQHLEVHRDRGRYICRLHAGPLVNRHRPSVETLFDSVAENVGSNAVVVMLTGMGDDGAAAMKRVRETGAYTIAQDEESSVVWGMPGAAVRLGAVDEVLPLNKIAKRVLQVLVARQDAA